MNPTDPRPLVERATNALRELHAIVWGECPSLLNEDSGGNGSLDVEIRDVLALAAVEPAPMGTREQIERTLTKILSDGMLTVSWQEAIDALAGPIEHDGGATRMAICDDLKGLADNGYLTDRERSACRWAASALASPTAAGGVTGPEPAPYGNGPVAAAESGRLLGQQIAARRAEPWLQTLAAAPEGSPVASEETACPHRSHTEYRSGIFECDDCGERLFDPFGTAVLMFRPAEDPAPVAEPRGFTATEDGELLCNACTGVAGKHDSECRYAVREVAEPRTPSQRETLERERIARECYAVGEFDETYSPEKHDQWWEEEGVDGTFQIQYLELADRLLAALRAAPHREEST